MEAFVHETVMRPATDQDWPFIASSWLKSYRHSQFANHIPPAIYFKHHHDILDRIKSRGAKFTMLAMRDQPDVVLGFSCVEGALLHYVYVKLAFRRIRLASVLIRTAPGIQAYTHLTKAGAPFVSSQLPNAIYNPYAI